MPGTATHTVRPAAPADRAAMAATLTRAFAEDPLVVWAFGRAERRPETSARFFRWYLDRLAPQQVTWTTNDHAAASIWALPGRWAASVPRQVQLAVSVLRGVRHPLRTAYGMTKIELAHPAPPHLYLAVLGVDPSAQGQGLGSALIAPGLARADEERWPVMLETANPDNLTFYARHGFAVIRRIDLPRGGPPVWLMWREPAERGATTMRGMRLEPLTSSGHGPHHRDALH